MQGKRLLNGFFNSGIRSLASPGRRFITRAHWKELERSNIVKTLAYTPDKTNQKRIQELTANRLELKKEIEQTEMHLKDMRETLHNYQMEEQQLTEPSLRYEQTCRAIEKMKNIIINGIFKSLLNGTTSMIDGPTHGYDQDLVNLFIPLLSAYGLTMEIKSETSTGEVCYYLCIQFPEKFFKNDTAVPEGATKYKEILEVFESELLGAYRRAEEKIWKDLFVLEREIFLPLGQERSQVFFQFEPCNAAYNLFKDLAAGMDISLSRQGSVIQAEYKDNVYNNQPRPGLPN